MVEIVLRPRFAVFAAFVLFCLACCWAQEGTSKPQENSDGFYSGNIVELTDERMVVLRQILGKPEKHSFMLNGETKVEGKMKVKSRVTVRYVPSDSGDLAVSVLVRDNGAGKKK